MIIMINANIILTNLLNAVWSKDSQFISSGAGTFYYLILILLLWK
jgi:hypothetical protein